VDSIERSQPDITLYTGFPETTNYVWSPYVTKVEARLRFAGLPYRHEAGSMSKAPRGKIPYVGLSSRDHDDDGEILLADSTLIINRLVQDGKLEDLNGALPPSDQVHDMAVRALMEDKLYFYNVSYTDCWLSRMIVQACFNGKQFSSDIPDRRTKNGFRTTTRCAHMSSVRCHIRYKWWSACLRIARSQQPCMVRVPDVLPTTSWPPSDSKCEAVSTHS